MNLIGNSSYRREQVCNLPKVSGAEEHQSTKVLQYLKNGISAKCTVHEQGHYSLYGVYSPCLCFVNYEQQCKLRDFTQYFSQTRAYRKNIYTCIYHMVTGYDLGYIKAPEYFKTGRNLIRTCTSLNIFSLPRVIELCYLYNK